MARGRADAAAGGDLPRGGVDRRRRALPRDGGRLREIARTVRQADRCVPGHQAHVRRHAPRRRVGEDRDVFRAVGGERRRRPRAVDRRAAREVVLQRSVLPVRRLEPPGARGDRVHLGTRRAPVLPPREVLGAPVRRPGLPPRAAGRPPRHLRLDFSDSPSEAKVRVEAREWLDANFPPWLEANPERGAYDLERARSWHRELYEGGWAAPSWPGEFGGRGFGPAEHFVWEQEKARIGANIPFDVPGFGMAGPTIIFHGTQEQKDRYLPPLLRGDETWSQLFSEPGAGSDLASVTTRADCDGDDWVVTGQKVWSSAAHEADHGLLLARFDFDLPKHQGLLYLLVDMQMPGIDVRPLKQMDGGAHFNEVFLDGVVVPDANR